jgi:hypothetical protein
MSNAGREIVGPAFSRTPVIRVLDQRVSRERWQVTRGAKNLGINGRLEHRRPGETVGMAQRRNETWHVTGEDEVRKHDQRGPEPRWCPVGLTKTQRRRL